MNIAHNLKDIKSSKSDYINQVFQTRLAGTLSRENLQSILIGVKESEKKKYDLENITSDDEKQFLESIQIGVSRIVNQTITSLADDVKDGFLQSHSVNTVEFYQIIERENYPAYLEQKFLSTIPNAYKSDSKIIESMQALIKDFLVKFNAEILMQDDLPAQDVTHISAVLLDKDERILVQRRNETKVYKKIIDKIFKEDANLVARLSQIFLSCSMIKRLDNNHAFNEKVEIEVVSELVRKNFSKITKYDEFNTAQFISFMTEESVSKFVQNRKSITIIELIEQLEIKKFNPESMLSKFKF